MLSSRYQWRDQCNISGEHCDHIKKQEAVVLLMGQVSGRRKSGITIDTGGFKKLAPL